MNTTTLPFDKGDKIVINYKTAPNSGLSGNSEHIYVTLTPQITGLLNSDPDTLYEGESRPGDEQ